MESVIKRKTMSRSKYVTTKTYIVKSNKL